MLPTPIFNFAWNSCGNITTNSIDEGASDNLNKKDIPADYLNCTLPAKLYESIKDDCKIGKYKILYISLEGLTKELSSFISLLHVSLFAIDETHTIMQWGFVFLPQYCFP